MNTHRSIFLKLFLILLLLGASLAASDNEPLNTLLEGIQQRYGQLPGFSVGYTREILSKSMSMVGEPTATDLATGKIYFKPPHFLKMEQATPNLETLLADGEFLWWYIPHKKTVYRYPSQKLGEELRLLVDIFRGLKKAQTRFTITLEKPADRGISHVTLVPSPPWPQVEHIILGIHQEDFHIQELEIHNYVGGITRFVLDRFSVRDQFEEGFFRFEIPRGVKMIEEEG